MGVFERIGQGVEWLGRGVDKVANFATKTVSTIGGGATGGAIGGATGFVLGAALTATGVGASVGVPLMIGSVATGTVVGAGVGGYAGHKVGDFVGDGLFGPAGAKAPAKEKAEVGKPGDTQVPTLLGKVAPQDITNIDKPLNSNPEEKAKTDAMLKNMYPQQMGQIGQAGQMGDGKIPSVFGNLRPEDIVNIDKPLQLPSGMNEPLNRTTAVNPQLYGTNNTLRPFG